MAPPTNFLVQGDPRRAFDAALAALADQGFRFGPEATPFVVQAERGSKSQTALLGAFAGKKGQHFVVTVRAVAHPSGHTVISLEPGTIGALAGAIGVARANEAYGHFAAAVQYRLHVGQVLLRVV